MFGAKSRALILGRGQLPAELAVCRQAVGGSQPGSRGLSAFWAGLHGQVGIPGTCPSTSAGPTLGLPGEGLVTTQKGQTWSTQAEGWSGDSLQFFCPAGLRPTSLRHRTLPPPLSAFAPCECIHSSWMDPDPYSHSSVAPFCPIGSFIWLAPLCRPIAHPSPQSPPGSQSDLVVLSLVCLTLCPP